jgi:ketopantoate reductase
METLISTHLSATTQAPPEPEKEFNICLVGAGGVGTIAALVLEKSGRARVTVVLRSSYDFVLEKGFDIESVDHGELKGWKPSRGTCSISFFIPPQSDL